MIVSARWEHYLRRLHHWREACHTRTGDYYDVVYRPVRWKNHMDATGAPVRLDTRWGRSDRQSLQPLCFRRSLFLCTTAWADDNVLAARAEV